MSPKLQRFFLTLVFAASAAFVGAVVGAFVGGNVWPSTDGGWEALGNALGGAVLGGGFSLTGALLASFRLQIDRLRRVAGVLLAVAMLTYLVLVVRGQVMKRSGSPDPIGPPVPVQFTQ